MTGPVTSDAAPVASAAFGAIILAGGTARRMGGIDKSAVQLGSQSLLDRAIAACQDAEEIVVVGAARPTARSVGFVREEPPHAGPLAGLFAGLDALSRRPHLIGVLAVDMPQVTAATFGRLRSAAAGHDGALLVDPHSRRRQLAGVLAADRVAAVRAGIPQPQGLAMRRLWERLDLAEVVARGTEARDVDTWADLHDLAGADPTSPLAPRPPSP